MNPEPGQKVRVVFNSQMIIAGTVVSWSDDKSVIEHIGSDRKARQIIIQKTIDSVLLVELTEGRDVEITEENPVTSPVLAPPSAPSRSEAMRKISSEQLKKRYDELLVMPRKTPDTLKKIAELKIELNTIEREELFNEKKFHEAPDPNLTQRYSERYVLPKLSPKPNTLQHSGPKGSRKGFPKIGRMP